MIILEFYGLDPFVVGEVSNEITAKVANLYEVNADSVNFIAHESMVYHDGVDQGSWHILVKVNAPKRSELVQDLVADLLFNTLREVAINVEIIFEYYSDDHHVLRVNPDYPRYMSEDNIVEIDDEIDNEKIRFDDEDDEDEEEDIYTGNIFQDFEKKLNNK